jgi:hypothetical protein
MTTPSAAVIQMQKIFFIAKEKKNITDKECGCESPHEMHRWGNEDLIMPRNSTQELTKHLEAPYSL